MKRSNIFLQECEEHFQSFISTFKEYKDNEEQFDFIKNQLDSEINYMKAMIILKEKNELLSARKFTEILRIGKRYSFQFRRRVLNKLLFIFTKLKIKPTQKFMKLYYKSYPDKRMVKDGRRNFVFVLDYSKSMAYGNKIQMALKIYLKIWKQYLYDEDYISFVRFNLNSEVVFTLTPKRRNKFQKRNQIESSVQPSERSSLYDGIFTGIKQLGPYPDNHPPSFMILFTDGPDTSSNVSLKRLRVKLGLYPHLKLLIIGLGLQDQPEHVEIMQDLAKRTGGYFVDIQDRRIDMVFDILCGFVQGIRKNVFNLTTESVRG